MLELILIGLRRYCMFSIICIYLLINLDIVSNSFGTILLGAFSLIALYHSVDMRGIYNTPDLLGIILIEMITLSKILF